MEEEDAFTTAAVWRCLPSAAAAAQCPSHCLPQREQLAVHQTIGSTNTALLSLLHKTAEPLLHDDGRRTAAGERLHLTVCASAEQTAGRGRLGRAFYSPAQSGIYFSFIYVPEGGIAAPALCTVTAAVGVSRAIAALYGQECQIKWVNDLYLRGKKICGILTEGFAKPGSDRIEAAVVGIGINVSVSPVLPPELAATVGGIVPPGERPAVTRARLLARCLAEILRSLGTDEPVLAEYRRRSLLPGKTVTVTPVAGDSRAAYTATVLGITDTAGLLVQTADGARLELHSGEVTLHEPGR